MIGKATAFGRGAGDEALGVAAGGAAPEAGGISTRIMKSSMLVSTAGSMQGGGDDVDVGVGGGVDVANGAEAVKVSSRLITSIDESFNSSKKVDKFDTSPRVLATNCISPVFSTGEKGASTTSCDAETTCKIK